MTYDSHSPARRRKPLDTGTKYEIFPEDVMYPIQPRAWGVQSITRRDGGQVPSIAVVYEPDFRKETAQEVAHLLNAGVNWDWEQTCDELVRRGFDVSVPPHLLTQEPT